LPAGFFYFFYSTKGAIAFRRALSPNHDGEQEIIRRTVAQVLEAHPTLQQSLWANWHAYLQTV
jgi:hypothetical protein